MKIDQAGETFAYEGVLYTVGAPVVGTPQSVYEGLYGTITEIRDGPDRETENETPDIYCAFDLPELPADVKTLEDKFSQLCRAPRTRKDIALDRVIMAPDMIRHLAH